MAALTITTDMTDTPDSLQPGTDHSLPSGTELEEPLGIAEVAERMGLTAHTLRYYERIGLLDVPRDAGGRRRYSSEDVARVHFITCLRKADLPINRIQHYFELAQAGPHTEAERLALLEAHRREVLGRLADLHTALETIEFKITMYGGSLDDELTTDTADAADATGTAEVGAVSDPRTDIHRIPATTG